VHGPDKCDLGYNVNVAVNTHFVREIQATNGQTQLVAPLRPSPQRHDLGPADCTLSADGLTLTCPNGQTSTAAYRSQSADGRSFRFTAAQCQDCPLWQACRGPKAAPAGAQPSPAAAMPAPAAATPEPAAAPAAATPPKLPPRQFFISDYRDVLAQARTFNATPAYKEAMKLRPGVERIIAGLTRYNDARRCRRRGLAHADYQAKMSAMAFNLKTWLRLLAARDRASQGAPA
jgi:hypothetical protein